MNNTSFTAAGYAVLIEDAPLEKYTSMRKTYAPVTYNSKTFSPVQLKMSIYAKEFLAMFFAFKEFGHIFWWTKRPVTIITDNKSVTRFFFQTKIITPTLGSESDYVIQFNFTTDSLLILEISSKKKLILRIREDIQTMPIELNIQSAGVLEEEQFFTQMMTMRPKNKYCKRKWKQETMLPTECQTFHLKGLPHIKTITTNVPLLKKSPRPILWPLNKTMKS